MNVIGSAWAQEILRRFWRVPAATALAPTLGTEIVPTFDLANPPVELASLGGVLPCQGYGGQGAVAGQYSRVTLNNNTPDRIYVVDRIRMWSAGTGGFRIAIYPAAGTTGGDVGVRDIRYSQNRPSAIIGCNSSVAQLVANDFLAGNLTVVNTDYTVEGPWVLPPGAAVSGYGLAIEKTAVNENLNVDFWWTERLVSPGFEITGL